MLLKNLKKQYNLDLSLVFNDLTRKMENLKYERPKRACEKTIRNETIIIRNGEKNG